MTQAKLKKESGSITTCKHTSTYYNTF